MARTEFVFAIISRALAWLFQKSGADAWLSSSLRSFCLPATSKIASHFLEARAGGTDPIVQILQHLRVLLAVTPDTLARLMCKRNRRIFRAIQCPVSCSGVSSAELTRSSDRFCLFRRTRLFDFDLEHIRHQVRLAFAGQELNPEILHLRRALVQGFPYIKPFQSVTTSDE